MMKVNATYPARYRNIYFNTTQTLRNEIVDLNSVGGDFIITVKGDIYMVNEPTGDDAEVTIVGGLDTFVGELTDRTPLPYLTQRQQIAIYSILKQLATLTDSAQLSSNDDTIDEFINSAYFNFCG